MFILNSNGQQETYIHALYIYIKTAVCVCVDERRTQAFYINPFYLFIAGIHTKKKTKKQNLNFSLCNLNFLFSRHLKILKKKYWKILKNGGDCRYKRLIFIERLKTIKKWWWRHILLLYTNECFSMSHLFFVFARDSRAPEKLTDTHTSSYFIYDNVVVQWCVSPPEMDEKVWKQKMKFSKKKTNCFISHSIHARND